MWTNRFIHLVSICHTHQTMHQFLQPVLMSVLNKRMNAYKNKKDDALTADWLRDVGLNDKTFSTTKLKLVRAQTITHVLLTQHRALLSNSQLHSLTAFDLAVGNKRERAHITDALCHCVMNINTSVNRKLFKQHRKLNQQHITAPNI